MKEPFVMIEELLCLKRTVPTKKNVNSDVRVIRNAFSHPEAIDKYYHYELKIGDTTEIFDHKRLVHYNSMIAAKCSVVIGLSMILRNLVLYRCELKHRKPWTNRWI